jgi:hypothetical protein
VKSPFEFLKRLADEQVAKTGTKVLKFVIAGKVDFFASCRTRSTFDAGGDEAT